jgi:hypothetical protein
MWCPKCHYGSEACKLTEGLPCPQCGKIINAPFTAVPYGRQDKKDNKQIREFETPVRRKALTREQLKEEMAEGARRRKDRENAKRPSAQE